MEQGLNLSHIAQALSTIGHHSAQPQQIHIANKYLSDCQSDPQFPLLLLEIYSQTDSHQLQLSSLLLFGNVVKRNWNNRGKGVMKGNMDKQQIKANIMKACLLHGMRHHKHFNVILKTMTRHCYPAHYTELQEFVLGSLQNMAEMAETSPDTFARHAFTVPVLSMIKNVIKQYSNKRIAHNEDDFKSYIAPVVGKSLQLSLSIQKMLKQVFKSSQKDQIISILQFLRKADKIALYALLTMPSSYQGSAEINEMFKSMVIKLKEYDDILGMSVDDSIREEIEKYMIGILELVIKGQNSFPFLFSAFLKDYITMLLNMLIVQVPQGRYRADKLVSTIVLANLKPINTYPYYTKPQDFRASIYCRKTPNSDNNDKQVHCYSVYYQIYTADTVKNMLVKLISEVMTTSIVVQGQKVEMDQLILQDVEIAIIDQVAEPNSYDNCISLAKMIIKNFKDASKPVIVAMFNELPALRQQGNKGNQIIANLMDIVLFLPVVMPETELPLAQVQEILSMMYDQKNFKYLARVIRKYFAFFDTKIQRMCLDILVQIVSSPISDINSSEVVYQAALALKTVLSQTYEFDGISSDILMPCIANILTIMHNKQFVTNPTLLWPIINLLIKLLASLLDSSGIEAIAVMIVSGLSPLLSSPKNEQLITCALTELMACLMHHVFVKLKEECPLPGFSHESRGAEKINPSSFVILDGAYVLVRMNLNNQALQNYDNIYRLWLALLRHYPTLTQQKLYNFQVGRLNGQLKQLFENAHGQVLEDSSVLFLQILEEMYLLELWPLTEEQVTELIVKYLSEEGDEIKRIRLVLATTSLYLTYALTRGHIPNLIVYFLKEILAYRNKVSPPANSLRCFLYLAIGHFMLTRNALQVYHILSTPFDGNFVEWFEPFLSSMQYVSSKEVAKINAAGIIKAIGEIGVKDYSQMLLSTRQGQYPIDSLLRVITAKLDGVPQPSKYHQENMYKNIIPNDMTPDAGIIKMKKIRLQFQHPVIKQIIEQDLRPNFKEQFSALFSYLNWGADDIQERVGYGTAVSISNLLGWEIPNLH